MATDDAIASLDAHAPATDWSRLPLEGAMLRDAGVMEPGRAARAEDAGTSRLPGRTAEARGSVETPGATLTAPRTPQMAIAGALDFLGLPALVVDSLGRVLDANRAAHLALTGELRVVNGRLSACSHRVCMGLRNLVMQAASARAMPPVVVPRSDQHPLLVYAFPFSDGLPEAPPMGRAIVIALDLGKSATPPALHLRHVFGLTVAQSRIAALLAGGTDLDTVAGMLGISKETARGHLRAIFARTGVRRQSELVALITRLLPVAAGALGELNRLLDPQRACKVGLDRVDR